MSIAILVLGYRAPAVLRCAVPIYNAANAEVFVHLDAKADLVKYVDALGDAGNRCNVIPSRVNIFWGGYSMVQATLELIHEAQKNHSFDRYVLISDDTFPIKSPRELEKLLSADVNRINVRRLDTSDPLYQRYSNFFFFDHRATALLGRPVEAASVDSALFEQIDRLRLLMARGKKAIPIWYGSQWWCLTRQAVDVFLGACVTDQLLCDSFAFSAVPDEIMFQTVVANYSGTDNIRTGPVLVDWSRNPRPYVFSETHQFSSMVKPEHGFIRKVAPGAVEFLTETADHLLKLDG